MVSRLSTSLRGLMRAAVLPAVRGHVPILQSGFPRLTLGAFAGVPPRLLHPHATGAGVGVQSGVVASVLAASASAGDADQSAQEMGVFFACA